MIYNEGNAYPVPNLDLLTFLFDSEHARCEENTIVHAEARDPTNGLTRAKTREITQQFAYFLRNEYGIGSQGPDKDVVVTVSNGQSALACAFYAVIAAEGIYSAASSASMPADLARQMKDGPGKVLICSEDVLPLALEAAELVNLPKKNVLILKSHPNVELVSADGSARCDFRHSLPWKKITDLHTLENRTICILYSSGTTGLPKGVRVSHMNMVSEVFLPSASNRKVFDEWERQGRVFTRRTIGHLPTAHVAGVIGYFVGPLYEGAVVFWMPKFDFDDFIQYCKTLEISFFFSVPPIFMAIAKHPAVKDQLKLLNFATSGAAPLNKDTQEEAGKKLAEDAHISQVWGMSETTGTVTSMPPDEKATGGSLGYLLPNVTFRLVDENEKDVKPGEAGEAWVKGPMVTKGYHKNESANKAAFSPDGWFKTGDILRVENNQLYIVDRKKELIKYKGLQVAPAELEGILIAHPAVFDAAVIGIAKDGNELPRAYVVLAPGAEGKVSESELQEHVKKQVAPYKQLRGGVKFIDVVPRSPAGKILRRQLRDMYQDDKAKL